MPIKVKSELTIRQHLLAASGNLCAFPGCDALIFDLEHASLIGDLAHIKGENPTSARYDETQTDDERRHSCNRLALCKKHHKIVDDREDIFPTESLVEMKNTHEERVANIGDRNWLKPANTIIEMNVGLRERIHLHYWIDRTGKPQIYSNRKLAVTKSLMNLSLGLAKISGLIEALENHREHNEFAKTFLEQSWAKLDLEDTTVIASILRMMAMTPDVTFGEFIGFVVVGNDPTNLLAEMAKKLNEVADKSPGLSKVIAQIG